MTVAGNGAPGLDAEENVSMQKQFDPSVMDGLSSSKVTGMTFSIPYTYSLIPQLVEYHDPSGLFPLVQEQLNTRLPRTK
jgi:hypothetical protein